MAQPDTDEARDSAERAEELKEAAQASNDEATATETESGSATDSGPAQIDPAAYREEIAGALGLSPDDPQVGRLATGAFLKDQARQQAATPAAPAPAAPTEPAKVVVLSDESVALNQKIIDDALANGRRVIDYEQTIGDRHFVHFTEYVPGPGGGLDGASVRIGMTETTNGLFGDSTKQFVKYFSPGGQEVGTVSSVIEDGQERITKVNNWVDGGIDLKEGDVRKALDPGHSNAGIIPSTWDPQPDGRYGKSGGTKSDSESSGPASGDGGGDSSTSGRGRQPGADPANDAGPTVDLGGSDGGDPMGDNVDPDPGDTGDPGGDDGGDPMPDNVDPDPGDTGDPGGDDGGDPMGDNVDGPSQGGTGGDGSGDSSDPVYLDDAGMTTVGGQETNKDGSVTTDNPGGATTTVQTDGSTTATFVDGSTADLGQTNYDAAAKPSGEDDDDTEYRDPDVDPGSVPANIQTPPDLDPNSGNPTIHMPFGGDPVDPDQAQVVWSDEYLGPDNATLEYRDPDAGTSSGGGGNIHPEFGGDPVDPDLQEEPLTMDNYMGPDDGTMEHVVNEAAAQDGAFAADSGALASVDASGGSSAGVEAAIGQAIDQGLATEDGFAAQAPGAGADQAGFGGDDDLDSGDGLGFGGQDRDGDGVPD